MTSQGMSLKAQIQLERIHMNNMNNQTNAADLLTTENEYWVDLAQALVRLESNPDFQQLILQGYFKDKAADGVSLLSSEYVRQSGVRGSLIEDLAAISALQEYFKYVKNMGIIDEGPLEDEDE